MQKNNDFEEVGMIKTGKTFDDKSQSKTVNNPVTKISGNTQTILNG